MRDEFASNNGLSAFSVGQDVAITEVTSVISALDTLNVDNFEDESDLPEEPQSFGDSRPMDGVVLEQNPPPLTAHDHLIVHCFRGPGDDFVLDTLVKALREVGWTVLSEAASGQGSQEQPRLDPIPDTHIAGKVRVALGLGLGGARAIKQGWDHSAPSVDGVVAICPFMGFDVPFYRGSQRLTRWRQRTFDWAAKRFLRVFSSRIECLAAYVGLGRFASDAISWADLVDCVPVPGFMSFLQPLACPTVIILDAQDSDLDAERALTHIPAMSSQAYVEVRNLSGADLLASVEHALRVVLRHHQAKTVRSDQG